MASQLVKPFLQGSPFFQPPKSYTADIPSSVPSHGAGNMIMTNKQTHKHTTTLCVTPVTTSTSTGDAAEKKNKKVTKLHHISILEPSSQGHLWDLHKTDDKLLGSVGVLPLPRIHAVIR